MADVPPAPAPARRPSQGALQRARRSLKMPDIRSLLLMQEQLSEGHWPRRQLDALAEDQRTRMILLGLLECTTSLQDSEVADGAVDAHRQQQRIDTKNMLCLTRTLCHEEATG